MCAWLVESFEPQARLTSVSIGYNVAQALGVRKSVMDKGLEQTMITTKIRNARIGMNHIACYSVKYTKMNLTLSSSSLRPCYLLPCLLGWVFSIRCNSIS
jgi:hypothetical protein